MRSDEMDLQRARRVREREDAEKGIEVVGKRKGDEERQREGTNACERAQDQKHEPLTHLPVSGLRQPTPDWELGQLPTGNWETDYKSSARGCRRAASKVFGWKQAKSDFLFSFTI